MKFLAFILVIFTLTATAAQSATKTSCYSFHARLAIGKVFHFIEPCSATVVVQVRVNGKTLPYSQAGNGTSLLIDYGWGAVVRLHQSRGKISTTAVTANPSSQRLLVWFVPQ